MKEIGIIPIVQGGLGNQIFINIAGYVMSLHLNRPLYLYNNTNCNNCHSTIEYKHNIFKNLGTHIPEILNRNSGEFIQYSNHYLNHDQGFEPWDFSTIRPGLFLQSYYQYYPALEPFEDKIREVLLSGLEEFKIKLLEKYDENELSKSVFLHIRRGDYVAFSDRHFLQPMEYYKYCIDKLGVRKIYLLSDDIPWVKSQKLFEDRSIFEPFECEDELTSLSFMTLCKAGAICANSTFSWWGAFLGAHEKRSPVFVPKKWMLTNSQIRLFPKEWTVVEEKDFT